MPNTNCIALFCVLQYVLLIYAVYMYIMYYLNHPDITHRSVITFLCQQTFELNLIIVMVWERTSHKPLPKPLVIKIIITLFELSISVIVQLRVGIEIVASNEVEYRADSRLHPANERRGYFVTTCLMDWVQA